MSAKTVRVGRDLLADQRAAAERFRAAMTERGTLVVRLLSSPGAGKTSLLEATIKHFAGQRRIGVLVGDVQTQRDAARLRPLCKTVQITTGGACHLELPLVEAALAKLKLRDPEFLFIEDVGNLVCPASFDLGEHWRVVLLSTTEGDDKPGKYPKAFRTADVLVIAKVDLLGVVPFSLKRALADARRINRQQEVFRVSALSGAGVADWCSALDNRRQQLRL